MSFVIDFKDAAKQDILKHQKSGQKKLVEKIKTFTLECQIILELAQENLNV